jgi:hypothetical protein
MRVNSINPRLTAVFATIDPLPTGSFAGKTEDISSRRGAGGSTILNTAVRAWKEERIVKVVMVLYPGKGHRVEYGELEGQPVPGSDEGELGLRG